MEGFPSGEAAALRACFFLAVMTTADPFEDCEKLRDQDCLWVRRLISSRSHLLIVVCGGRGWKFNLGFGLHSCKANSYYLNCIYSILFGREIAWSHCVRLVTDLFKLLLMLVIGRIN